jgi:uncharacterized protein with PIN domain
MAKAEFRFYEELNDFLPPSRRKRDFSARINPGETVKHAIEACGVPHTEVELILVNGKSVDFSCRIHDGDRISVYPQFETFDISPLLKVREHPVRNSRFIADVHLGGLARYLRMLGFDTLYNSEYTDEQIAQISANDRRIVLTRDRDLLMHKIITHGRYVRAKKVRKQLIEVVKSLDLYRSFALFSRCIDCNTHLVPVDKEKVKDRLQSDTQRYYTHFVLCPSCDQVYWQGSHYQRMQHFFMDIFGEEEIEVSSQ